VLVVSTVSAPSAMAETKTTTAYTCEAVTEKAELKDEHCTEGAGGAKSGWKRKEIPPNTNTEITGTNAKTAGETGTSTTFVMIIRVNETRGEIVCENWELAGPIKNFTTEAKEMKVTAEKLSTTFSKCSMKGELAETGCKIAKGEMSGSNISGHTPVNFMEMEFKGETKGLISFTLEGCSNPFINIGYEITGSAFGIPEGAVMTFTESSTNKLKIGKEPAAFSGKLTLRMKGGEPIVFTTILDLP
jgi:hypothetical protein